MGGGLSKKEIARLREQVDMSAEDIKQRYTDYKSSGCKDKITVEEFKELYSDMATGDATEFAENIFRIFDKDGNGKVNFEEFLIGICVTSSHDPEKKLSWAFNMYDIDGNGSIDRHEMTTIIRSVYRMHHSHKTSADTEAANKLTENILKKLDTDKDGKISWGEFKAGAMNDPFVVDMLQKGPNS